MPIGIDTLPRIAVVCSQRRQSADTNFWQSKIELGYSGIEPDCRRIETPVLRKESLRESVPSQARFIHHGWRDSAHVRQRNQSHASRRRRLNVWGCMNTRSAAFRPLFSHALVVHKEERLILQDRAAKRAAKLIVVKSEERRVGKECRSR